MSDVPGQKRREIEEILKEIAADPNAKLLSVPSAEKLLALADQPKVGVYAPGLSAPERHLLRAHREELAFLLRERCVIEFYAEPDADLKWHRSLTADRDYEVPDEGEWERRACQALEDRFEDARSEPAFDALGACAGREAGQAPGIAELAAASLRIAPSDQAHIYMALKLMEEGRHEQGRNECRKVLEHMPSAEIEASCWENIGYSFTTESRYDEATVAYRSAVRSAPARSGPIVFWLTNALAAGDHGSVAEAAAALDSFGASDLRCVDLAETLARRYVASNGGLRIDDLDGGLNVRRIRDAFHG